MNAVIKSSSPGRLGGRGVRQVALPLLAAFAGFSAEIADAAIRLTGIANVEGRKVALVELQSPGRALVRPILRTGDRMDRIEVVSIDDVQGTATFRNGDQTETQTVPGSTPQSGSRTINLGGVDLGQALDLYQTLLGRTLIYSEPALSVKVEVRSEGVLGSAEAANVIETVLARHNIRTFPIGTKFVLVSRQAKVDLEIFKPPTMPDLDPSILPEGFIKFANADVHAVLDVYQELTGRTVLQATGLRGRVTLRTQTSLTRQEAIWLVGAALGENGCRVFNEGDKLVLAVPSKWPRAPVINSNARFVPANLAEVSTSELRFGEANLSQVLIAYARWCKRVPGPIDPEIASVRISLRAQTPLIPWEAVYTLDAAAALQGVEFVVGDREVTARRTKTSGTPIQDGAKPVSQ